MFYRQCWECGERWSLGTASTCKCPDETPKREWVGLTDEDLASCSGHEVRWALYWEKLLKEKNNG